MTPADEVKAALAYREQQMATENRAKAYRCKTEALRDGDFDTAEYWAKIEVEQAHIADGATEKLVALTTGATGEQLQFWLGGAF